MEDYNRKIRRRKREIFTSYNDTLGPIDLKNRILEGKVLNLIESNAIGGVSKINIAKAIGMNRKNLGKHLRRLQIRTLVRQEKGRQGRFFPNIYTTLDSDSELSAEVLARLFLIKVLKPDEGVDIIEVKSPHIQPRLPCQDPNYDLSLERIMLDFSNVVGAFITYILIQSMNQVNSIATHIQDAKEKDLVIQKWVAGVIAELQEYLLPVFRDYIQLYVPIFIDSCEKDGISKSIFKYKFQEPRYVFDDSTIADLTNAFSNVYPNLYYILEQIRKRWPKIVQKEQERNWYVSMSYEIKRKCKHDFKNCRIPIGQGLIPTLTQPGSHCRKCHLTTPTDKKKY